METTTTSQATDAIAEFDRLASICLDSLSPDERKRAQARIEEAEAKGRLCADSDGQAPARVIDADVASMICAMWRGLTPTEAARESGLDIRRDWGRIHGEVLADPRARLVWDAATRSIGDRLVVKAAQTVEAALDGAEVSRAAARLAPWVIDRAGAFCGRGGGGHAATPAAAAQVVINISDRSALEVCGNLLQGGRGGVISA